MCSEFSVELGLVCKYLQHINVLAVVYYYKERNEDGEAEEEEEEEEEERVLLLYRGKRKLDYFAYYGRISST